MSKSEISGASECSLAYSVISAQIPTAQATDRGLQTPVQFARAAASEISTGSFKATPTSGFTSVFSTSDQVSAFQGEISSDWIPVQAPRINDISFTSRDESSRRSSSRSTAPGPDLPRPTTGKTKSRSQSASDQTDLPRTEARPLHRNGSSAAKNGGTKGGHRAEAWGGRTSLGT